MTIRVNLIDQGSKKKLSDVVQKSTTREGYFTFPFQEQRGDNPAPEADCRIGVQFELSLYMDAELDEQARQDVKNAIKAWIAFGGVGARTRRGCGALQAIGENAKEWLPPSEQQQREKWFKSLVSSGTTIENLPALTGGKIVLGGSQQDARQTWSNLGTFWARFRKGHVGRIDYSPKMGLPIVFKNFKDGKFHGNVKAGESGRMASPIVLKPLALSNGAFLPMVAVLKAPRLPKVKVKGAVADLSPPAKDDPVMKELSVQDVYDAVIVAAQRHVGAEVVSL